MATILNKKIDCTSYAENLWELLVPSPIIFSTLCVSIDKTNLFIMSFTRLIMYIILYYVIHSLIDLDKHKTLKYALITIICINIVYIGIVVAKNALFRASSDMSMYGYVNQKVSDIPVI